MLLSCMSIPIKGSAEIHKFIWRNIFEFDPMFYGIRLVCKKNKQSLEPS